MNGREYEDNERKNGHKKTDGEKRMCVVGMGEGCETMSLTPVTVCGLLATLSTAIHIPLCLSPSLVFQLNAHTVGFQSVCMLALLYFSKLTQSVRTSALLLQHTQQLNQTELSWDGVKSRINDRSKLRHMHAVSATHREISWYIHTAAPVCTYQQCVFCANSGTIIETHSVQYCNVWNNKI